MPKDRDRDRDRDEDLDEDERPDDEDDEDRDDSDDESDEDRDDSDDESDEDRDDSDDEPEDEPEERPQPRDRQSRASARKKRAEQRKSAEPKDEEPRRSKRPAQRDEAPRQSSLSRRERGSERKRSEDRDARRSRRTVDDERPRRAAKQRGNISAPKRRPERKEVEISLDIVEPETPPEADIDLGAELEPTWEPGLLVGGGLGLAGVAFAVVSLMTSGSQVSTISVIGLVILLMAIASGDIGVLARKSWGYVLGLGAGGLGVIGGLLWSLYAVVSSDLSPLWPLFFCLCNLGSVIFLFQMRWGPGLMASERDRVRSLKLRTSNHTTVSGELALSGSIAAVLASVLCGLLLMGAAAGHGESSSAAARFVDGMDLETFTEPPAVGDVVLARWGNEDYFFLGRVEQTRGGDEFYVVYLDGDRAWVRAQDIRRDAVRAGASVHIHVQGHDGWLPAIVTQRSGNRVEADVGNQRVWVQLGMVRVREAS